MQASGIRGDAPDWNREGAPRASRRGAFLSRQLYWKLVRYLDSDLAAVPPVDELLEMLATFGTHARKDEAAVQGKFKNWARRIRLVPDSTLMLGNRVVVPRDRYADIAWTFHIADPQRHLTISEVVLRIQTVYTWGRQNFGMCWEVAAYVCGTCDRPACRSRSAHLGAAAYLNFDNCGGRVSGVQFPPPWLRDSVRALAWAVQNRVRLNPLATSVELRLLGPAIRIAPRSCLSALIRGPPTSAPRLGCPAPRAVARGWPPGGLLGAVRLNSRDSRSAYSPPDRAPGVARAERLAWLLARRLRDRASLPRILRIIDSLARDGCPWHGRAPTRSLRRRKLPKAPCLDDAPGPLPNYRSVFEEPKSTRGGSSWLGRL